MIRKLLLILIKFYQQVLSLLASKLLFINGSCRFSPSCSEYTYQAIEHFGVVKGLFLGIKRLLRCQPLGDYINWLNHD